MELDISAFMDLEEDLDQSNAIFSDHNTLLNALTGMVPADIEENNLQIENEVEIAPPPRF